MLKQTYLCKQRKNTCISPVNVMRVAIGWDNGSWKNTFKFYIGFVAIKNFNTERDFT